MIFHKLAGLRVPGFADVSSLRPRSILSDLFSKQIPIAKEVPGTLLAQEIHQSAE